MTSKNERLMDYIAGLEAGEKVSVRKLAQVLGVSEGTAYKSIKQAEAQGLVITRPKVGTVRINLRGASDDNERTLAEAARSIGAVCLCGSETAARISLPYVVVADGDEKQFRDAVRRVGGTVLCVIGGRPELYAGAVELGCHVLLSGGSIMEKPLLHQAEKNGLCVFASEQDSSTLLGMLNRRISKGVAKRDMPLVRDWMQSPRYLYHDDMVTEWYRLYSDMFYRGSDCTVVDDRLQICGTVEAAEAMKAQPLQSLSAIMKPADENSFVSEDMSMEELAEMFVRAGRLYASVNSPEGLSGFIGMSDVIRYYLYNESSRFFGVENTGKLEIASDDMDSDRRLYSLHLADMSQDINRSGYISSIYSAAAWHAHFIMGGAVELISGSINSIESPGREGEYLISSSLLKRSGDELLLELELYDDMASYAKGSIRYKTVK